MKINLQNLIYQIIWAVLQIFIPRKKNDVDFSLLNYDARFFAALQLADLLRFPLAVVVIGDSSGETLATFKKKVTLGNLLKKGVVLNFAIGGTLLETWTEYLCVNERGRKLLGAIQDSDAVVLLNIGGNNVLHNKQTRIKENIETLRHIFSTSVFMLIPPIHIFIAGPILNRTPKELEESIKKANATIVEVFQKNVIDTYTPFLSPANDGTPHLTALSDVVHFSDRSDFTVRIPAIAAHINNKLKYNL